MRRRDLLALVGGGIGVRPVVGVALENTAADSKAGKPSRIGLVFPSSRDASHGEVEALLDGLHALGWDIGGNIVVREHWAEGHAERLPAIAGQLVSSAVDVLVAIGTPATVAASSTTATVPIVFVGVGDPVGLAIVNSLARPGGNLTGVSLESTELIARRLELLREIVPHLGRIAVIVRADPGMEQRSLDIRSIASRMGVHVREFQATTGKAVELAFIWLINDRADAIYVASGPLGPAKRAEIIALAAKARLPAIYSFRAFPAAGGLMSFGTDEKELFRRAAILIDKILKGAKPSELPIEPPAKFQLVINMKTASEIGVSVPQSILARADEVIE
jgi:putative tryptophan/tyrosine transport system substrate-binding protein